MGRDLSVPAIAGPSAWITALFFQQVHIAAVKGWPLVDYLALIPLLTAVSVTVTLASGAVRAAVHSAASQR